MKIAKRIFLFVAVNILIVSTISIILSVLGISPSWSGRQLDIQSLAIFCLIWGFGAAFVSLALSRIMAKWMMGVTVIKPEEASGSQKTLLETVYVLSRKAGLKVMPEVGFYESPEVNAFATGPTKNRALVAVSTGLLEKMNADQVEGVLAHEVAHISNGDMVTMTLVQGVVNAFVMFLARVLAWGASQFVEEERRPMVQFAVTLALELGLGFLGMFVVAFFSRQREFRADAGGANLAGRGQMISALEALKRIYHTGNEDEIDAQQAPALASLKISSKNSWLKLLSTHPDLEERISRLEQNAHRGLSPSL